VLYHVKRRSTGSRHAKTASRYWRPLRRVPRRIPGQYLILAVVTSSLLFLTCPSRTRLVRLPKTEPVCLVETQTSALCCAYIQRHRNPFITLGETDLAALAGVKDGQLCHVVYVDLRKAANVLSESMSWFPCFDATLSHSWSPAPRT
jgi:hypothetical protein